MKIRFPSADPKNSVGVGKNKSKNWNGRVGGYRGVRRMGMNTHEIHYMKLSNNQ